MMPIASRTSTRYDPGPAGVQSMTLRSRSSVAGLPQRAFFEAISRPARLSAVAVLVDIWMTCGLDSTRMLVAMPKHRPVDFRREGGDHVRGVEEVLIEQWLHL